MAKGEFDLASPLTGIQAQYDKGICTNCGSVMTDEEIKGARTTCRVHGMDLYWCQRCFNAWGDSVIGSRR